MGETMQATMEPGKSASSAQPRGIMPILNVDAVEPLLEFYVGKLGFEDGGMGMRGEDGALANSMVALGSSVVMIARPPEGAERATPTTSRRPLELYVYVPDVDAHYAAVVERGAPVPEPPVTQWWGDRTFQVQDPYGHLLWFSQSVAEPQSPEGADRP